jgi:Protein of unknown function (DUF3040)
MNPNGREEVEMPLSEYEQRVLEQLERDLGADPKLGHAMAKASRPRGRWTWAVLGILVGLGVVLAGAMIQVPIVGIVGFAVMLGSALWGLLAPAKKPGVAAASTGTAPAPKGGKGKKKSGEGFMRRVEDRFDRRREQGDL